ncbi:hypothetical protein HPP92_001088 [Vanilla planifolia]|uniref:Uncharacterized protein n=1 Tax=Vanilla planifolia TaxID=51239 RepID=A0A835S3I3_VANPL|nr:hypothetical protein HPP92_001088 [Vanilla planifolia]
MNLDQPRRLDRWVAVAEKLWQKNYWKHMFIIIIIFLTESGLLFSCRRLHFVRIESYADRGFEFANCDSIPSLLSFELCVPELGHRLLPPLAPWSAVHLRAEGSTENSAKVETGD